MFLNDLHYKIPELNSESEHSNMFEIFGKTAYDTLQKCAPLRKRYVRVNLAPSISKTINKEIMKRTSLRNKFLNSKCDHGGMFEKEIQLFLLSEISIYLN